MSKRLVLLSCFWLLLSCGPDSGGSSSTPTTDVVSSSATISFLSDQKTIRIVSPGGDAKSTVPGLENICAVSLKQFKEDINYEIVGQNQLSFGPEIYTYKRALQVPKSKAGIPDRVFSVWSSPNRVVDGVSLAFELEIEPELLTFRLLCSS